MKTANKIKIGDRVESGRKGAEDYDRGTVDQVNGDKAVVRWDSEVVTQQPIELLRKL